MNRQDRQGVRTAQDLERKYKLAEIRKAFEQSEQNLTKVNKIMQDFVNAIIGSLDNLNGLSDGHITTYFYEGVPTLETVPTTAWQNGYEEHINDHYYNKDSGKAYIFVVNDEVYSWEEVIDESKIKALAMANATIDTKDGLRRLFLEEPIPPYDNGDLWVKDGIIYACQISKPETEVFENHDFILSSEYDGDALAIKVGKELEVLKGTVLKIVEDASQLKVEVADLDTDTTSSIELLKSQLATLIVDENGQSMMTQTSDGLKFEMKSILETMNTTSSKVSDLEGNSAITQEEVERIDNVVKKLEEKTSYVEITERDGQPCIELGASDSEFKVVITNTAILFLEGTLTPAHINNETMHIKNASIENELSIGKLAWVKRGNGHVSLMAKGV